MDDFFRKVPKETVPSPNGHNWWHHMPLPDGSRIKGANEDSDLQLKMWEACKIPANGLAGKTVLDIGANDGFFTLAALKAGAKSATAINSDDWAEYPDNITYAAKAWDLRPEIITADFRTYPFREPFDVVFFFGVLYHLEDVFNCMKKLRTLLKRHGELYIETQMSAVTCDLPIFESASDIYKTKVIQFKQGIHQAGLSNYLLPNEHAMVNLAHMYDFEHQALKGPHNRYTAENPHREFFKFKRIDA